MTLGGVITRYAEFTAPIYGKGQFLYMRLSLDFTGSLALTDVLTRACLRRRCNMFIYDDEMDGVVWVIRHICSGRTDVDIDRSTTWAFAVSSA